MISNIQEVREKLKPLLLQYLEDNNVKVNQSKMFTCINPEHRDNNPSASLTGTDDSSLFCCHGCNASGDIFSAAHYIENRPMVGYDFIVDNLKYLADKYNVPYQMRELTEEEKMIVNVKHLYNLIAENASVALSQNPKVNPNVTSFIADRKINTEVHGTIIDGMVDETEVLEPYKRYDIGWIPNYDRLIDDLVKMGFDKDFIISTAGITRGLFAAKNLLFSLRDKNNAIVGFSARNCTWKGDGAKYINIGSQSGVFKKKNVLYNLHNAIKRSAGSGVIYVVEGYLDAIALDREGIPAVALSGANLMPEHLLILTAANIHKIVLILDGDKTGYKSTAKTIIEVFFGVRNISAKVIPLPAGSDPDSFINEFGIDAFNAIEEANIFDWYLSYLIEEGTFEKDQIATEIVPLIVNEKSHIEREKMVNSLSSITGVSGFNIFNEIDRLENMSRKAKEDDAHNIIDLTIKQLHKNPSDAQAIFLSASSEIDNIEKKYNNDSLLADEYIGRIQKLGEHQLEEGETGYKLPGMGELEYALKGTWRGKSFFFGGEPNAGKTNFMINLALSLVKGNLGKVSVLYHSTDDSAEDIITRLATLVVFTIMKYNQITIQKIEAPKFYAELGEPELIKLHEKAVSVLVTMAKEGHLIIKDSQQGRTLSFARRWINQHKRSFPDREIVYIVDNFHNLADFEESFSGDGQGRLRIKKMANYIKNEIAVKLNITTISTVEYRKGSTDGGRQQHNERVAESKTIEYVSNFMGHLLNPFHSEGDGSNMFHTFNGKKLPVIELLIGKNKVTSQKGSVFYKTFQEGVNFTPLPFADAMALKENGE